MNVLLIWEVIPENTKAYILVPGEDDKLIELAKQSHGYYIGGDENDAVNELNLFLSPEVKPSQKWDYDILQDPYKHLQGPFSAVYISGFLM